jgi:hypothetical protein
MVRAGICWPALDHARSVVLGQVDVEAKTNEIPLFATLLDRIHLAGAVATADALHAQCAHAEYLAGQRGAHYLITVKATSPACTPSSPPCPGVRSPSPTAPASKDTAAPNGAPSKSLPWPSGRPSRTPPRPSRLCAVPSADRDEVRTPRHGQLVQPGHHHLCG